MAFTGSHGQENQKDWDPADFLEALGFRDTGARLGPDSVTGRIRVSDNAAEYENSCGLYAWVNGREVHYVGITDTCLRSRNYKHAHGGAASAMLLQSRLTVEVWFMEEPSRQFESATLLTRRGTAIEIPRPDVRLLERFLITLGQEHRWDLWNFA